MTGALVVRADAGPASGSGHAMRMIALGEEWLASAGDVLFVTTGIPRWLEDEARRRGIEVQLVDAAPGSERDREALRRAAEDADWVVIDGYSFSVDFQAAVEQERLVVVDDHVRIGAYRARWVIDQNVGAQALKFAYGTAAPGAGLLLGTRYALVRQEFTRTGVQQAGSGEQVLVTLGGAPPPEACVLRDAVVDSLEREGLRPDILSGSDKDVARRMHQASLALSAAGTTALELCAARVPAVLISIAENQVPVAAALESAGAATDLGWYSNVDVSKAVEVIVTLARDRAGRTRMAAEASKLVDGRGARRVVRALRVSDIHLRHAQQSDARLLWRWANDPDARNASFMSEAIPWEAHATWFDECLSDPGTVIYVAEDSDGNAVGQIRFEKIEGTDGRELSVSVAPSLRGRGYGAAIIRAGVSQVMDEFDVDYIDALVKSSNDASLRSFRTAGFEEVGPEIRASVEAIRFRWAG